MPIHLLSLLMRPLHCRTRQHPWLPQTRDKEHGHMQRPHRTGQTASNSLPKASAEVAARARPPLMAALPPGLKWTQVNAGGPGGMMEPPSRLFKAKWPLPLPWTQSPGKPVTLETFFLMGSFMRAECTFSPPKAHAFESQIPGEMVYSPEHVKTI